MCGHHLPAGTWVFMPQWSLSRNRSLYGDDADVFEPERWLAKEGSLQELRINDWKRLDTTVCTWRLVIYFLEFPKASNTQNIFQGPGLQMFDLY